MRAAKVQASLRIHAVSPEPSLLAHTSNESRGTFRQRARSLAPLNGWACAVKICHDGMLEDTNSLDRAHTLHDPCPLGLKETWCLVILLPEAHTCHKLLTEFCETRQIFKGDLIKFCEVFTKITLDLPPKIVKSLNLNVRSLWKHNKVWFIFLSS